MSRLDEAIASVAYILDCMMAYRNMIESGDCNRCKNQDCKWKPKPGQLVRYNCPFYEREEDKSMILTEVTDESKCCCSCRHNKRTRHEDNVFCHCGKDGHYIGYVANFTQTCEEWEEDDD